MVFKYAYLLPLIAGVLFVVTVAITYTWSTSNKHVKKIFPYISDTGTWAPESCVFSLSLFVMSVLLLLTQYIRYRQVKLMIENSSRKESKLIEKLNLVCAWTGYISSFGIVMVASFQETNAFWPHVIGANFVFGVGSLYQCLQTFICWKLHPEFGQQNMNIIKIVLSVISSISFWIFDIFGLMALRKFDGDNVTLWNENDGGYNYHLVSTISEWISAISTMAFITIHFEDLKHVTVTEPGVSLC